MAPRSARFGVRSRKLSKKIAFAVVSTHQPALGPHCGLWPVLLMCVIHKEGLCPSSGDINRLMMINISLFTSSCLQNV
jgi:hypothetical protein